MSLPKTTNGINSWPTSERPRERLKEQGAASLSDAELIAILLRNGLPGKDAITLARELVTHYGGLRGLLSVGWKDLEEVKGLGAAKIATLISTTEIARRQLREEIRGKDFIRDPQSIVGYLSFDLRDKKKEVFKVLFLNRANHVINEKDLFHGTVDQAMVHPREVVKAALDSHATSVVLVHNHPSGRIEPSREDREITNKLHTALLTVSIKVLDHLIVGDNTYFSFREHNLLL
ncbi:MAG: hypothetical protein A3G33_07665 [Omnitrophica bacterium RIFCSPLOWO2_12_FULL_44_17]|uniref:MPN domain-containing protein n=1 Tax=Candidatus Danuiimicrobium aquiferis TaxID=1801832 RepID=A0A1G1L1S6_9BACT|nr:MAG: hypothetical protein A3B72_02220 [Omnitrophica bacterium RIFCSPHIGHO2_02_FULL_45_28]OGW92238.1 MAG: hypothetical protein A3E74_09515 [Omnitrophica bacterium RIFCSPHIGHO2_12_FULL_44_12]OGW99105.1 MAG: hypothetical protein A3G33_07665 [Omnitrophica bacterium RIFCSPLOWO2_12_FULL_44_17]